VQARSAVPFAVELLLGFQVDGTWNVPKTLFQVDGTWNVPTTLWTAHGMCLLLCGRHMDCAYYFVDGTWIVPTTLTFAGCVV